LTDTLASLDLLEAPTTQTTYDHVVYGLRVRSGIHLTAPEPEDEGSPDVEIVHADADWFAKAISDVTLDGSWIEIHELAGGWSFIRYDGMFQFLISPSGHRIFYRLLGPVTSASLQTYALGRVFSFALVKMGYEPLHASTVVVDGRATAFMGASGFGKSSLASCFVAAGYPLLTDDVLRIEERNGGYVAFPGPPCLKLLPRVACRHLGRKASGVPINNIRHKSPKMVFALSPDQRVAACKPLAAIYVVSGPRNVYRKQRIAIRSLSPMRAVLSLLSFTHNHDLTGSQRLSRQFDAAQRLAAAIPIRTLAYPRILTSLDNVKDTILDDLRHHVDTV